MAFGQASGKRQTQATALVFPRENIADLAENLHHPG